MTGLSLILFACAGKQVPATSTSGAAEEVPAEVAPEIAPEEVRVPRVAPTIHRFAAEGYGFAFDDDGHIVGRTPTGLVRWTREGELLSEVEISNLPEYCGGGFTPAGDRYLCTASGVILLVAVETGAELLRLATVDFPDSYQNPVWHPAGERFAVGGSDLHIVDLRDGSMRSTPLPLQDPDYTRSVEAFLDDDRLLVDHKNEITEYIFGDADLWVGWDHHNYKMRFYRGREPAPYHTISTAYSTNLHLSPDGLTAYLSGFDGEIYTWDLSAKRPVRSEADFKLYELDEHVEVARPLGYDDVAEVLTPDGVPTAAVPWHYRSCVSDSFLWTWWGRELVKLRPSDLSVVDRVMLPEGAYPGVTGCSDAGVVTSDGETTWWRIGDQPFDGPLEMPLYESELMLSDSGDAIVARDDGGMVVLLINPPE